MKNKTFLAKMKLMLTERKTELLSKVSDFETIDAEGDETDAIQANLINVLNNQMLTRNKQALVNIESALERIKDDSYGVCQDCEEIIPEKRLLINPYFTTCVGCAEDREYKTKGLK